MCKKHLMQLTNFWINATISITRLDQRFWYMACSVAKALVWSTMMNFHAYIARKKLLQNHGMYFTKNMISLVKIMLWMTNN